MKKCLALFPVFLLFPTFLCFSQSVSLNDVDSLYYSEDKYEESIRFLKSFASSDTVSLDKKKEAMKLLARSYLANGNLDKAYATTQKLAKTRGRVKWDPTEQPRILNYAYYRSIRDSKGSYLVGSEDRYPKYLVLGVFRHGMSEFTVFGNSLSYFINKSFEESGRSVVERERVRWMIDEFSKNYLTITPEKAYHFGRLAGVEKVVFGTYEVNGDLKVRINVVNVKKAQVSSKNEFEMDSERVVPLFERVVSSLLSGDVSYTQSEIDVVFEYSKALKMSFKDKYMRAEKLLNEVVNSHSGFNRAEKRLRAVNPIIAIYK